MTLKEQRDKLLVAVKEAMNKIEICLAEPTFAGLDRLMNSMDSLIAQIEGEISGDSELVKVQYWLQETIESGRWITVGPMKRSVADKGIRAGIFSLVEIGIFSLVEIIDTPETEEV